MKIKGNHYMSLKTISITLADEIIKIYSDLLLKRDKENIHYYPYSALKGYDILDIENSLKLLTALRVYRSKDPSENKQIELKKIAAEDGGAILIFFRSFIPDNAYKELSKYVYGTSEYRSKEFELLYTDEMPKEMRIHFDKETETIDSFLDFCIKSDRNDLEYWLKVYARLNLIYNNNEAVVKYLQFLTQKKLNPFGDYFQTNFTFVIKNSLEQEEKTLKSEIKSIAIRITGREDASLRGTYKNYELEPAFFTIAKNYLGVKIEAGENINVNEELFSNALKYLDLDIETLEEFHTEDINILLN